MLGLNITIPVLYGCAVFLGNYFLIEVGARPLWVICASAGSDILSVLLQIISGVFLFYALFQIKQFITKDATTYVNLKKMALHSSAFGLYMLAAAT